MSADATGTGVHPGPDEELLAGVVTELAATRAACFLADTDLTLRWVSPEMRAFLFTDDPEALGYGLHLLDALALPAWAARVSERTMLAVFRRILPYACAHAEQKGSARWPELQQLCRELDVSPTLPPAFWTDLFDYVEPDGTVTRSRYSSTMLGHATAGFIGCVVTVVPALRATVSELLTRGDEAMYERIAGLATPRQDAAAVLFADLEDSAGLSRRLSTAAYFDLIRRLLTRVDEIVADHAGIVGKHAGDGATAFFRAVDSGSASAAARAAIEAARAIAAAARALDEDGLSGHPVAVNTGLHYAPAVYLGQLITSGRLEVTALGDDVTVTARLQQTACGGDILVSKALMECLDVDDAKALSLDPAATTYLSLDEWPTVTDKARRDAPRLPVCRIDACLPAPDDRR